MEPASGIRFGCQFYTWQMSGDKYQGKLDHITKVVGQSGFAGIEPETVMLGNYYDAGRMRELLAARQLELGALTLVCDWCHAVETDIEKQATAQAIDFLGHFPGSMLVLCQMPGKDREHLRQRQDSALNCIEAVAGRASARGIPSAFHPNSPAGSVFRTSDDYSLLLGELHRRQIGFAPDTGHIIKGGMDVQAIFESAATLIRHVHFKDIDANQNWVGMRHGITDFPRIVQGLNKHGFRGWIMVEEESAAAETDPDTATRQNGQYIRNTFHGVTRV